MSAAQSVGSDRFRSFLLPDPAVRLISVFLTADNRTKMAAVCKRWRDHAILLEERQKKAVLHPGIISVFGRPGSGKGTFAQRKARLGYKPLSLGDEMRR